MAEPGNAVVMSGQESRSEETLLLDHVHRIERSRQGTYAVHIHLSDLRSQFLQPHYIRVAARAFDTVAANFEVVLYRMVNADMVLICRETPVEELEEPIYKLRALFGEDPLTLGEEGGLDDHFSTWYDLTQSSDYDTLLSTAEEMVAASAERLRKTGDRESGRLSMPGEALSPTSLVGINRRLQATQIADLIRNQTAIVINPGAAGDVLFREFFVSMSDLQKRIAPDINLFANPWLFQFLTETVDRLVLANMANRNFATLKDPMSLNLNIKTVMSSGFQAFHKAVGDHTGMIVIEMQIIDIFADMDAYEAARTLLREQGYRVLIDGLNPLSLQYFDPALLDADFVKIAWSPEFLGGVSDSRLVEMRDVIAHTGQEKVIMARVDSEDAVKWGLGLGIRRYQGHYADRIVAAMTEKGII